jgi:hypothetical protein
LSATTSLCSVDGELVATLEGLADDLDTDLSGTIDAGEGLSLFDSFFVSNPTPAAPHRRSM